MNGSICTHVVCLYACIAPSYLNVKCIQVICRTLVTKRRIDLSELLKFGDDLHYALFFDMETRSPTRRDRWITFKWDGGSTFCCRNQIFLYSPFRACQFRNIAWKLMMCSCGWQPMWLPHANELINAVFCMSLANCKTSSTDFSTICSIFWNILAREKFEVNSKIP